MTQNKCPICNGTGKIISPNKLRDGGAEKIEKIKKLKHEGYSIRSIMKMMGFKSPSTIKYYLNK